MRDSRLQNHASHDESQGTLPRPFPIHDALIPNKVFILKHMPLFIRKNPVIPLNASGSKSNTLEETPNLRTNIQFKSKVHERGVLNPGFLGPKP